MRVVLSYADALRRARYIKDQALGGLVARSCMRGVVILSLLAVAIAALPGCTVIKYTSPERTLTLIDLHPTQNALSLEGMIEDASLSVNREQGGAEEVIRAATPNPLD